ncbi:hypothetical protein [Brasilonema sp. UFV-L1]|uniref:hypothetical protein n=1 Tax=Brasilonema sp. UFV-L1 TaxID=2234130 RepID=UPI001B7CF4D8|nr:hypothetical protein [Brasilonema sp. UFV-L1]
MVSWFQTLVVQERFWILVVESKRTSIPVPATLPQLLAYMLSAPQKQSPTKTLSQLPVFVG